jgi:DNA processing protein
MKAAEEEELFYQIALTQTGSIGDKLARALLGQFGTAKDIFNASARQLASLENFGEYRIKALKKKIDAPLVEKELNFIQKNGIHVLFLNEPQYPQRLKACPDAPILLYHKGTADLNAKKIISIVGTRTNTDYGLRCTESLVEAFKMQEDILIVSGLAYGIDAAAHKKAVQLGIPTLGVVAHGLDCIYPAKHRSLAREMLHHGGLLTEYPSGTIPEKPNFPMRNRIVAGLADVTVIVETDEKGGSMITAKLAASYNREIAAFPGRSIDPKSRGCNYLIKSCMAQMITSAGDLMEMMGWEKEAQKAAVQKKLFAGLSGEELKIADILGRCEAMHIDELHLKSAVSSPKLASILLSLELDGIVKSLPGKKYRLT